MVLLQSIFIKYMHGLSYKANVHIRNEKCSIMKTFATLLRSLIGNSAVIRLLLHFIILHSLQFIQTETSTPTLPDNKIIQYVYGIWFWSCLIISCFFTTTLTSFFTEPGQGIQLETISDIIQSKIPIAINELYFKI